MSSEVGKDEYNLMKGKLQSLTEKLSRPVSLTYDLIPLNSQQYNHSLHQLSQSMKQIDPQSKDLSQFDELILGKIQGQSAYSDFRMIIESIVGEISEDKLKGYLKQKTEQRNYGLSTKDKNCSIKQVKKIQLLNKYFDIKQITKKRKHNQLYRYYIRSLQKFIQLFQKTDQNDNSSILLLWQHYQIYMKQQKKYQLHLKQLQSITNICQKQIIIEQPVSEEQKQEREEQKNQIKIVEVDKKISEEQQLIKSQENGNVNKTPKKYNKTTKKSKKDEVSPKPSPIINQNQNQQILTQVQVQQPVIKKDNQKKLDFFVIKKPQIPTKIPKSTDQVLQTQQQPNKNQQNKSDPNKNSSESNFSQIWHTMGRTQLPQNLPSINQLRSQFKSYKMQNQQSTNQSYFINIIITLSTIEYYDYLMKLDREVDFSAPFKKIRQILYFEDESEQFEGESASGNMQEQQSFQSALSGDNKTILDDDHLSNEQLSSCQSNQLDLKVQYGKANKWIYNHTSQRNEINQFNILNEFMIICLQSQALPLRLDEEQQKIELVITPEIWREIYKITHGYFGVKDSLIKQLSNILPNVSKNWIDTMLKQRSQKNGNQRFIMKEFIEDLKEKIIQIQQTLQRIKSDREGQLKRIRDEKNQQKDLKLQKDILQCEGSRYIINLMKQLKEKGYKQLRKKQLIDFINERQGQEWQKIKAEMNTMSRPIIQMIRNMQNVVENHQNNQIECEEQVIVEDEQYHRVVGEKQQPKSDSHASTKQKQQKQEVDQLKRFRKKTIKIKQYQKTLNFPKSNQQRNKNKKNVNLIRKNIEKDQHKFSEEKSPKEQQKLIIQENNQQKPLIAEQANKQSQQNINEPKNFNYVQSQLENKDDPKDQKQQNGQNFHRTSEKIREDQFEN